MIFRISAENFELNEDLDKYARKKIAVLTKYIPRKARQTTLIEAIFSTQSNETIAKTCKLSVKLRREEISVRETTQHMYASLDVAVADIERQLRAYRLRHRKPLRRHIGRLKRNSADDA